MLFASAHFFCLFSYYLGFNSSEKGLFGLSILGLIKDHVKDRVEYALPMWVYWHAPQWKFACESHPWSLLSDLLESAQAQTSTMGTDNKSRATLQANFQLWSVSVDLLGTCSPINMWLMQDRQALSVLVRCLAQWSELDQKYYASNSFVRLEGTSLELFGIVMLPWDNC